jgi:hypothetical protein
MLFQGLECVLNCWNAIGRVGIPLYRVGMLTTELEYLCTGLECFRQSWNSFVQGWNAFDRVGIPLYRVGMLSTVLACFIQCWNTFVHGWNAF